MSKTRLALTAVAAFVASCGPDASRTPVAAGAAPAPSLVGRATTEDGVPLAGAAIRLEPTTPFAGLSDARAPVETRADADGAYAFDGLADGDWAMLVAWDGAENVPIAVLRAPSIGRFEFRLPSGAEIVASVQDAESGASIVGATVSLWSGARRVASAVVGTDGRVVVRTHRVVCKITTARVERGAAHWLQILAKVSGRWPLLVRESERVYADLLLPRRGGAVTGVVEGPAGPLEGAKVSTFVSAASQSDESRLALTDARGRYRLDGLPPGETRVDVYAKGFDQSGVGASREIAGFLPAACAVVVPETGEVVHDVTMVPDPSCVVAGSVVDEDGRAIEGATVMSGAFASTKTGRAGEFVLEEAPVRDGVASVFVAGPSPFFGHANVAAAAGGRVERARIVLHLPTARLRGRVADASGAPIAGVRIVAALAADVVRGTGVYYGAGPSLVGETRAADDGSYSLPVLGSNCAMRVFALAPHCAWKSIGVVPPNRTDTSPVRFDGVLDAGWPLVGRVVDRATKRPVAGAFVAAHGDFEDASPFGDETPLGGAAQTRTDADGRFRIDHVSGESCTVEAWGDGLLRTGGARVSIKDDDVVLGVEPATTIEGWAEFDDGTPAVGVVVGASPSPDGGWSARTTTGPLGRFVIRRVGPGPWTLFGHADDSDWRPAKVSDVPGGARDVRVVVSRPAAK